MRPSSPATVGYCVSLLDGNAGQSIPELGPGFIPLRWCEGDSGVVVEKEEAGVSHLFQVNFSSASGRCGGRKAFH